MFKDSSQFYDYEVLQLATTFTERTEEAGRSSLKTYLLRQRRICRVYVRKNNTKGQIIP